MFLRADARIAEVPPPPVVPPQRDPGLPTVALAKAGEGLGVGAFLPRLPLQLRLDQKIQITI
mgnify:CR=1 FL=1